MSNESVCIKRISACEKDSTNFIPALLVYKFYFQTSSSRHGYCFKTIKTELIPFSISDFDNYSTIDSINTFI